MKRKTIIGSIALAAMIVLNFLGWEFISGGDTVESLIVTAVFAIGTVLLLFLALKGRENREAFSLLWNIIGWTSTVMYAVSLFLMLFSVAHFFGVNGNKEEIKAQAQLKIEYMDKQFDTYEMQCQTRKNYLLNELHDMLSYNPSILRQIYPLQTSFTYNWSKRQSQTLYDQLNVNVSQKRDEWFSADGHDYYQRHLAENWNPFVSAVLAQNLDELVEQNLGLMKHDFENTVDPYESESSITPTFKPDGKTPEQLSKYFTEATGSGIGWLIGIILLILALFPVLFVPLNRVNTRNKRYMNIYQEGFSIDKLSYEE